jgi:hypothetical protein
MDRGVEGRHCNRSFGGNLLGNAHLGDLDVDEKVVLKRILKIGNTWTKFSRLRTGSVVGCCEYSDERCCSIKDDILLSS